MEAVRDWLRPVQNWRRSREHPTSIMNVTGRPMGSQVTIARHRIRYSRNGLA